MHELGIMTGVMDAVVTTAQNSGATQVVSVRLRVGEMTEAIEDALRFAFEAIRDLDEYALCRDAALEIEMVAPKSHCLECGEIFTHDRFHMLCPKCGSFALELLEGREMQIDSIEVELPDEVESSDEPSANQAGDGPSQ